MWFGHSWGAQIATFTDNIAVDARALATRLDQAGFVCLENVVSPDWLARARAHVHALVRTHGKKFFVIIRPADERPSVASEVAHHPLIRGLLRELTEIACPRGIVEWEDVYNTLRVVAGSNGQKGSCEFHYDASVITALVPISIPEAQDGRSGELVISPNRRGYRNLLVNLVEKAVVQSNPYRRAMAQKFDGDPEGSRRILKPGNIYLFWGYRSYHGNMPCPDHGLRATLLLHYGNPHGRRTVLQTFRNIRKLIESRRITH